jgi:hypothetical protein
MKFSMIMMRNNFIVKTSTFECEDLAEASVRIQGAWQAMDPLNEKGLAMKVAGPGYMAELWTDDGRDWPNDD